MQQKEVKLEMIMTDTTTVRVGLQW